MVSGLMLLIVATMKLFPELPVTRAMHLAFVEVPLRRLAETSRSHLLYAALLVTMTFGGIELLLLLGSTDMLMLFAWDVSLYVDALIASWTLGAAARGRAIWKGLAARCARLWRPGARPRSPRRRHGAVKEAANDGDEDGGAWRYARAA